MSEPTVPSEAVMKRAADLAEKFVLADFGGNDIAGLRNGIMADSAIEDFVREVARLSTPTPASPQMEAATLIDVIGQAIHNYCARFMVMTYLDAEEDCDGIARDIVKRFGNNLALSAQPAPVEGVVELIEAAIPGCHIMISDGHYHAAAEHIAAALRPNTEPTR